MDWENWWALELDSKPSNDLKLIPQIYSYYKSLYEHSVTVDFVHPEADLSRYKLVIAPNLYLVNEATVANINRYVEEGGHLVMSFFSGIADENEHIRLAGYPAPFREMLGLVVEEYAPYSETQVNSICTTDHKQFGCSLWSDVMQLKTAQAMATFEQDYYAGSPAVTRNQFGKGNAFYVGTVPDSNGMDWLIETVCEIANVKPILLKVPTGVEILKRVSGDSSWLFVLNHTSDSITVQLGMNGHNLLTGLEVNGSIELEAAGVAIVQG